MGHSCLSVGAGVLCSGRGIAGPRIAGVVAFCGSLSLVPPALAKDDLSSLAPKVQSISPDPAGDPLAWQREPAALHARAQWRFGTAALVTSVLLGAGAVVLGSVSPCAKRAGNSCFTDARSRAVWSIALPATVLGVAGALWLVVGGTRWKRLRQAALVRSARPREPS